MDQATPARPRRLARSRSAQSGAPDDIRRVLEIVERRAGPLVEAPAACPAVEPRVAECGAALPPGRRGRAPAGTGHRRLLVASWARLPDEP